MAYFEIVAHRGITAEEPENTLPAFQRAIELGADAIELDVRLTSDHVPVVYHYYYLHLNTSASGAIFEYTFDQLQGVRVRSRTNTNADGAKIPSLTEVLEAVGGRIGLEIEIKGPEPESPAIIGDVLRQFKHLWQTIEITSYEPALLLSIQEYCPGLIADLLFPRSEDWMKPDVITYQAIHRARLARARAVHLHPTQLSPEVVSAIRQHGIAIHAWEVNDEPALKTVMELNIPRICTDKFQQALSFRRRAFRF
jgi:glycerophosphoryl diester phosphodiesterase